MPIPYKHPDNPESKIYRARISAFLRGWVFLVFSLAPVSLAAQNTSELKQILERLARLEAENRTLAEEVHALRGEIAASRAKPEPATLALEEKLAVQEKRIEEQAQVKVEASQRFPIRLTGMALFNTFLNSRSGAPEDNPTIAPLLRGGPASGGATLRQTVLGLNFQGPETVWNGKIRGSFYVDFFADTGDSRFNLPRIRTASIEVDWKNRSFLVGQEKPIFAPREPNSLSQVVVSPLTGAGNLWIWQPQIRLEQRFQLTAQTGLRAQIGVVQTTERAAAVPVGFGPSLSRFRPGLQGRFEIAHALGEGRRIELAPGFHTSTTHVAATSVPSSLFSMDWFANPWRALEFSGAFFTGQNVAHLGTGGIRQGFVILVPRQASAVHSKGGWAQFTLLATGRLSFNIFGGQHDDRNSDLLFGGIARNQAFAGNLHYRLAPNVILGFEASQVRTAYLGSGNRLSNHYDLAFAYLF